MKGKREKKKKILAYPIRISSSDIIEGRRGGKEGERQTGQCGR